MSGGRRPGGAVVLDDPPIHLSAMPPAAALASLRSSPAGLSPGEAARRLAEFGPNRLEEAARERLVVSLARELTHFFAIILWIAAGLAFAAELARPGEGMARLGFAVVGVIAVNGAFSFWQKHRAERAMAALRELLPPAVQCRRGGAVARVPAAALVPGDVVLLEAGDVVPADARVVACFGLRLDLATLTGESQPRARVAEASQADSALSARNLVLAGTSVVSGRAEAVLYATGMRTEFGRIAHLTQTAGEHPSPLQREIGRLSWLVALLATGLGVVFFAIGRAAGLPVWESGLFGVGIIVANVPEGLLPTLTLSLALATQRMARRNALVRHLPAVEALGAATVICCDKTGTLTENRMSVRRVLLGEELLTPEALRERPALAAAHRHLFLDAALCHDLPDEGGAAARAGDPMEVALAALGREHAPEARRARRLEELPFDTERKRMSVVCETERGRWLYCKGALETVLPCCATAEVAGGRAPLDDAARGRLRAAEEGLARSGLRVLAFAHAPLDAAAPAEERELAFAGLVALEDPPRAAVPQAVARCATAGIRVIMVTGDHPRTALAVAREIGLVASEHPRVVTGEEMARLTPAQLQLALDAPEIVFARVAAQQKMTVVRALQRKGEIVAVTGDGVNDAPALKLADVGVAMGVGGTDVAREAADVVLLDDDFATIVAAIEEGRSVFENIRKFLTYILTSNVPELVPYLASALFHIPLPLTVLQILAVDLGTDMLPALGLGAERPDPALMTRPPRSRRERLLSPGLLARAYLFLGALEALAAMAAFFFVLRRGGWRGEALGAAAPLYREATTACLAAIVVAQVVNVFLCRHPRRSSLDRRLGANRVLLAGVAVELALLAALVYTPAGRWLFATAPLDLATWGFMLPFAALMWALDEARKAWLRNRIAGPRLEAAGGRPSRPATT